MRIHRCLVNKKRNLFNADKTKKAALDLNKLITWFPCTGLIKLRIRKYSPESNKKYSVRSISLDWIKLMTSSKSIYKIIIIKENGYIKSNLFQFNLIILIYIITFLFVNSNVTCCENPRMTVMIFYLFMINSFINLRELMYKNK